MELGLKMLLQRHKWYPSVIVLEPDTRKRVSKIRKWKSDVEKLLTWGSWLDLRNNEGTTGEWRGSDLTDDWKWVCVDTPENGSGDVDTGVGKWCIGDDAWSGAVELCWASSHETTSSRWALRSTAQVSITLGDGNSCCAWKRVLRWLIDSFVKLDCWLDSGTN